MAATTLLIGRSSTRERIESIQRYLFQNQTPVIIIKRKISEEKVLLQQRQGTTWKKRSYKLIKIKLLSLLISKLT